MIYKSGTKVLTDQIGPAYWFVFCRDELLINSNAAGKSQIPYFEDTVDLRLQLSQIKYLGLIDGEESYFAELKEKVEPNGCSWMGLKKLYGIIQNDWYWLANRAYHLLQWSKKNRYCGVCGGELGISKEEVALECARCGNIIYPRISPAIIVEITKGEKILLAHAYKFSGKMYSLIAGFVEAGETLEECVAREIHEEIGIKVRNIRYACSQPWPYPDSLMIAFTAEYESGEISIDGREITDANWYTKDNLPDLPLKVSVARKLIDAWVSR